MRPTSPSESERSLGVAATRPQGVGRPKASMASVEMQTLINRRRERVELIELAKRLGEPEEVIAGHERMIALYDLQIKRLRQKKPAPAVGRAATGSGKSTDKV